MPPSSGVDYTGKAATGVYIRGGGTAVDGHVVSNPSRISGTLAVTVYTTGSYIYNMI